MTIAYDADVLVAADRGARRVWDDHRMLLRRARLTVTTAPVVAQVSRSGRQALLRRFLAGCQVEPFLAEDAHAVGTLLARTGSADVVDAHLVVVAARTGAVVLTADLDDLAPLVDQLPRPIRLRPL